MSAHTWVCGWCKTMAGPGEIPAACPHCDAVMSWIDASTKARQDQEEATMPDARPSPDTITVPRAYVEAIAEDLDRALAGPHPADQTIRLVEAALGAVHDLLGPGRASAPDDRRAPAAPPPKPPKHPKQRPSLQACLRAELRALGGTPAEDATWEDLRRLLRLLLGRDLQSGPVLFLPVMVGPPRVHPRRGTPTEPRLTLALRFADDADGRWVLGWSWRRSGESANPRVGRRFALARSLSPAALRLRCEERPGDPPWPGAADAFVRHFLDGKSGHPDFGGLHTRLRLADRIHEAIASPDPGSVIVRFT